MRRVRRSLFACAVAVSGAAAGCSTADTFLDRPASTARGQLQTRPGATGIASPPKSLSAGKPPVVNAAPPLEPADRPLPINLATALRLSNARPLDVQIAGQQVAAAAAVYDRARVLWLPNVSLGTDYFAHTGPQQNFAGELVKSNRNTFMAGFGPNVVFSFSDAVYAPLAARQELRVRQAQQQSAANDSTLAAAEAYFGIQQARGDLAGALAAEARAEELARKTTELAKGLAPPAEEHRARAELGRRKLAVAAARERWRTASAELARVLRLDAAAVVEPAEPAFLPVTVIDPTVAVDDLIPLALSTRPELAGNQALVQATLARLKQEKIRPLVPSLAVRSVSTNPSGSLGYGTFGGGRSGDLKNFDGRFDIDVQLLWEFSALGLGNRARVHERRAEHELATLELFRTQDRIAAEVATAFAQVRAAALRLNAAEPALREAIELVQKSTEGLGQTRRVGDALTLVVRPQEAVAAVQAFAQANTDFFAAVADYNRAQFRLYRALGHPAQCLAGAVTPAAAATTEPPGEGQPRMNAPAQPEPLPVVPSVRAEPVSVTAPPAAPELKVPLPDVAPPLPSPKPAVPLPVQEWVSVPGAPLPPENRSPVVIEETREVVPKVPDGK
ncbi:TolC family protein [Gemmata sp. JC673]|uniref:TolC family protein n=1 Tax=Gemmata algarum TaxID=2975278 RepID=A0ABU5EWS8_9BACT|nr:TolC family protein [Gemmata algarum]MDY3559636.1 TolC family protein [Gemmata algarum]